MVCLSNWVAGNYHVGPVLRGARRPQFFSCRYHESKYMHIRTAIALPCLFVGLSAQPPDRPSFPDAHAPEARLPNGKLQRDEILKAEYEKSLLDAAELIKIAEDLKADLEKNTAFVVSIPTIKKTEEIEKIAKRIRARMKRS